VVGHLSDELRMSISRRSPPRTATQALRRGLERIASDSLPRRLARARARLAVRSVIELRLAVPLYRIARGDLKEPMHLSREAQAIGWRCFVPGFSQDQAADVFGRAGHYEMGCWSEAPENRRFLNIVAALQRDATIRGERYQLRCLQVPVLHLTAVWLHHRISPYVVPVSWLPMSVKTGHVLTLDEFQTVLVEKIGTTPTVVPIASEG
jgi:hypothetical protein